MTVKTTFLGAHALPPEAMGDKDAFIAASKPIYDEFGKEVAGAKDVIDRAVALGK